MTLYEFYGEECPHCQAMEEKVDQVKEEENVEINQLEVWHDKENAKKMKEYDDGKCGGVPFFYNTKSEEWICGETDVQTLKKWAHGKEIES